RIRGTSLACGIGKALRPLAVVAPVLAGVELVTDVEVSEHQLVSREALPAPEERALEAFARCHADAIVALHGHPDHEAVEGTLIAGCVSCARDRGNLARGSTEY